MTSITIDVPINIEFAGDREDVVDSLKDLLRRLAKDVLREKFELRATEGGAFDATRKLTYSVQLEVRDKLRSP